MASAVYVLCTVTSALCAILLLREYARSRARLLLWAGLSFVVWALNNALVFADLVALPDVDLSLVRTAVAFVATTILLFALIWDAA